jgi:uncharacterized membrane protein YidH (DUF202 family)
MLTIISATLTIISALIAIETTYQYKHTKKQPNTYYQTHKQINTITLATVVTITLATLTIITHTNN